MHLAATAISPTLQPGVPVLYDTQLSGDITLVLFQFEQSKCWAPFDWLISCLSRPLSD